MNRLEISLLGPFQVTLNSEPVTQFRADTALALHAGIPCRRETLAGLLWPDQPESEARHNLRQALSRLRTAIGDREADPPFLLTTRKTVQFRRGVVDQGRRNGARRLPGRGVEGHHVADARRAGQTAAEIQGPYWPVPLSLPQPGARGHGHDAQLPGGTVS